MKRRSFLKGMAAASVVLAVPWNYGGPKEKPVALKKWRVWRTLTTSTTPLTEGIIPAGRSLTYETIELPEGTSLDKTSMKGWVAWDEGGYDDRS